MSKNSDWVDRFRNITIGFAKTRHYLQLVACVWGNVQYFKNYSPQFISSKYKQFASEYGFEHVMSSPYWQQGNGKAEAAVKIIKKMYQKNKDIHLALLDYRNTPQQGQEHSPAQRLVSRRTRGILEICASPAWSRTSCCRQNWNWCTWNQSKTTLWEKSGRKGTWKNSAWPMGICQTQPSAQAFCLDSWHCTESVLPQVIHCCHS